MLRGLMVVHGPRKRVVRFGVFELDLDTGELRKQGIKLQVQPKPLQMLQILLERPGKVVSREELRRRLWAMKPSLILRAALIRPRTACASNSATRPRIPDIS